MKQKIELGTLLIGNLAMLYYLCLAVWDFSTSSLLGYEDEAMKREFVAYSCGWSFVLSAIVTLIGFLLNWLFLRLIFGKKHGKFAWSVAGTVALFSFYVLAVVVAFGTYHLYHHPLEP